MTLSKLALTVTEDDINRGLEAALEKVSEGPQGEGLKKIKNPRVELKKGLVVFKCRASMGIMPVPVEAQVRLEPAQGGAALNVTLEKLSMAMMAGNMIAGQVMAQLATAVAGKPGLSVSGTTLTVEVNALAQMRGIKLGGALRTLEVNNRELVLDFE
ncbi:MAG TPA: hypothetical protein IAC79_00855 [Candidatus Spyradenecus faecavium]|uniref:Uncharacterized protein n=1 Tax=Candidatus Spyradenecus faecavium TaxID=2840947 RepID=A0A9D1T1R4_9BACT|nr:hypothetical protein [Candidatus Spyradenecus faecavium]